jgi:NADH-quinone oxidoreductase subunit N
LILPAGQTAAAWQQTVWLISAATLILGNIVAIAQTNIKRLLAYSSIAHAGYVLMAVAAAGAPAFAISYAGGAHLPASLYVHQPGRAFAVVLAVEKNDGTGRIWRTSWAGEEQAAAGADDGRVYAQPPILLTSGFIGKWFVFRATLDAGLIPLAIIGVLTSVVSAFYYVRVIVNMYLREGEGDPAAGATQYVTWSVYVAFAGTLLIGIIPSLVTNLVQLVIVAPVVAMAQ